MCSRLYELMHLVYGSTSTKTVAVIRLNSLPHLRRCKPAITHNDIAAIAEADERSALHGQSKATIALQSLLRASLGKSRIRALNL